MFTAESLPGMVIGLIVIVLGAYLGVRSTIRRRDDE